MRAGRPRRSPLARWLPVAAMILLAGCAREPLPQSVLAPEGPVAELQDDLWDIVWPVAAVVFVLVEVLLVVAVVKFRARGNETGPPRQVHGNTKLELLWTIIPTIILLVIAVPTIAGIFALAQVPEDPLRVNVVGKQYFWEFTYTGADGEDVYTATELHIPANRPVFLEMDALGVQTAEGGVLHSFWVPRLAGKQDVVPGHTRTLTIEANEPGQVYSGQCAEFCGLSHANMLFRVYTHTQEDFDAWLAAQAEAAADPTDELAQRGAEVFTEAQCIACHAIEGYEGAEARVGPNLTHFASRNTFAGGIFDNNEENLRAWLENPPGVKPGAQMPNLNLSEDQITALIAYLATLE
jgi:cytochrome c oxidase subunit 2